jgi:hypothetical protein
LDNSSQGATGATSAIFADHPLSSKRIQAYGFDHWRGAEIQVLHVRFAVDIVNSGLGDDAPLGLRAAASLARPLRDHSRLADAPALLDPVYDRFSEGFETADPKSAKTLLDALGHAQ